CTAWASSTCASRRPRARCCRPCSRPRPRGSGLAGSPPCSRCPARWRTSIPGWRCRRGSSSYRRSRRAGTSIAHRRRRCCRPRWPTPGQRDCAAPCARRRRSRRRQRRHGLLRLLSVLVGLLLGLLLALLGLLLALVLGLLADRRAHSRLGGVDVLVGA